jgi:hypothetical protein
MYAGAGLVYCLGDFVDSPSAHWIRSGDELAVEVDFNEKVIRFFIRDTLVSTICNAKAVSVPLFPIVMCNQRSVSVQVVRREFKRSHTAS